MYSKNEAFNKVNELVEKFSLQIEFPIPAIQDQTKSAFKELNREVDLMLQLNKEKQQTNSPAALEQLQQRIHYTDDKINKLVYELYGLTEEEIKIVEGR